MIGMPKRPREQPQNTQRKLIALLLHPRKVSLQYDYPVVKTHWGNFHLLPTRLKFAAFFDPVNWLDFKGIRVEPKGGHQGRRHGINFQIVSKDPRTGIVKEFVLKDQDFSIRSQPNEIEAALLVSLARVPGEKPWGYWADMLGNVYAVFEFMPGRTLMLEPKTNFSAVLAAARKYGRLYAKGLLHQDTGTKHVFVSGKKVKLFDFETLVEEPFDWLRERDIGILLSTAVAEGRVATKSQLRQFLAAFLQGTGVKTISPELEKKWLGVLNEHVQIRLRSVGLDVGLKKTRVGQLPFLRQMVLLRRVQRELGELAKKR